MQRTDADGRQTDRPPGGWFASGLGKVHVLYVSPEWARDRGREFDAGFLVEQLVQSGVDCVEFYAKDHHGNVYFPSTDGPDYGRDIVGEMSRACRARGVRFIAYVSVSFDELVAGSHPDWLATDANGRTRVTGPFRWLCLRSPYRALLLRQIETLVTTYEVDGLWLDIIPLAWPSAYTTTSLGTQSRLWMLQDVVPCYCHACRAAFVEAHGRPASLTPNADEAIELFEFGLAGVRSVFDAARDLLRRHRPDAVLTYNAAGAPGDAIDAGDLVSIEGHAPFYERQGLIARWARGRGQPSEVLAAGALPTSPSGWDGFDRKPAPVLELERAVTAAHGGSTVFGHQPYPNGRSDAGQFDGLRTIGRSFTPIASSLVDPRPVADVLLASTIKPSGAPRLWGRMLEGIEGWHDILRRAHQAYDIGGLDRDLSAYQLVVLPEQLAMSDREIDTITAFVDGGGNLLATGETSLYDEAGRRRDDFGLAAVFGVSGPVASGSAFTYITRVDPDLATLLPDTPIVINRSRLLPTVTTGRAVLFASESERPFADGSTLLWGYPPPDPATERPLGFANQRGEGQSLYIAVPLDPPAGQAWPWATGGLEAVWTNALAGNIARHLVTNPLLVTNAPPSVELVLNAHRDHWMLHALDYAAADPRYVNESGGGLMLAGITVSLDAARVPATACWTRAGRALPVSASAGRISITIPDLGVSEQLRLQPST